MLPNGTRIGAYEIVSPIGAGGMGEVYRARDTRLNRDVAIKILPEAFASDPDRIARFVREAQTLASLNHPHIAQIYGVEGGTEGGTLVPPDRKTSPPGHKGGAPAALVMEFVAGETLADRLARGALAIDDALPIARQIAEALEAAHDAGIIHRDLKPANIKLRPDGTVKVLDFGLAKAFAPAEAGALNLPGEGPGFNPGMNSPTMTSPAMTQAGVILGTAAYMSPEQARGKAVDKRADIWAFGCVLSEMLTGRAPFHGETVTDVIAAVVKNEPDWNALPPDTPSNVRRTLARCLRKDPHERLRDIGDARLDLAERDTLAHVAAPARTSRWPLWLALTAGVAVIVGGAIGWFARQPLPITQTRWTGVRLAAPAVVMSPVLSPDGQLIAFQTIVDGQSQIGVMNPSAGTWRVLTSDRSRGLTLLQDWSPDGSRIYFDRQTDTLNGVFSVPSLGGDQRLVLENAGYPISLPNGELLVMRVNAQRRLQLHRFSPSTGRVDPLPALPEADESDRVVVVSSDGRRAYFFGQPLHSPDTPPAFYQLDLETGRTEPLATNGNLRRPVALGLQRNTGDIVVGGFDGDAFQLMRVPAQPNVEPRPIFSIPGAAQFDVDAQGTIYVNLRSRPAEMFALPATAAANARSQHYDLAIMQSRTPQRFAPLPDGSILVGTRAADRDRLLVVKAGRDPSPLIEGVEETRPPATAVGPHHAAVLMGPIESPDIAIVNTADGRLVRRFRAPSAAMTSLGASPDGGTLYYTVAGSVWSLPSEGGTPTRIGVGDSLTVDPDNGDLIVKLDEGARMRLVRMRADGGDVQPIPMHGELRLIPRALAPGAVRQGRLVLAVASADSWFWNAATLDLKSGVMTKLVETNPSDFHFVTWRADGVPVGFGYGLETTLWRFTSRAQ